MDHCSLCFFCIPCLFPLFLPHKEPPIHPLLLMSSYFSPQPSSASCLGNRAGGLQGQCSGCESYKWYLYQYLCLVLTGSWGQRSVWAQTHLMDKAQLLHQLWMAQGTEQLLLIFPSPSPWWIPSSQFSNWLQIQKQCCGEMNRDYETHVYFLWVGALEPKYCHYIVWVSAPTSTHYLSLVHPHLRARRWGKILGGFITGLSLCKYCSNM